MDVDLPYKLTAVAELTGHEDRVWHVAWNPTKPLIATCSADKSIRLYSYAPTSTDDAAIAFSLHTALPRRAHEDGARARMVAVGTTLASASFDSNIGIWQQDEDEPAEWDCTATLEGHETECKSVAWSASGTLLASCSRDKTVWVWEAHPDTEFECMGVLMEHEQDVKCVAWHPSEEILASGSYDDTIKLYLDDPNDDWFCFATLTGHTGTVWSLAWAPNGRYLASASDDLTIRIWKRVAEHKWECVSVLEGAHERSIYSISWGAGKAADKESSLGWLASTGSDGKICCLGVGELKTPPMYRIIAKLENAHGVHDVNSIAWCYRKGFEHLLATSGDDGSARVWRISPA